jgi:hypothetical protein
LPAGGVVVSLTSRVRSPTESGAGTVRGPSSASAVAGGSAAMAMMNTATTNLRI